MIAIENRIVGSMDHAYQFALGGITTDAYL
jgi:hypothetical protein